MLLVVKREVLLKGSLVLAICFIVLCPTLAQRVNKARCEISPNFGTKETAILKKACNLAAELLQSEEVRREVYERAKYARLTDSILSWANATVTRENRWYLLQRQLVTLSLPNGENDTEPAFPDIFIRYGNEPPQNGDISWLGRARIGTVAVYWDGKVEEWKQKGSFDITINDYFVARGQRYSDPNDWAGTIAHEMLHNLGHNHPHWSDPNYPKYQINVLDELIQNYGYGSKGSRRTLLSIHGCAE